ncbi:MAG: ACT domain-containing protein [Ilumatobacteraceae bacterium]
MSFDLVIEVDNQPGALAHVAAAVSDAGVNLAAATCLGKGDRTELHILVPHAEPVRHALAVTHEASITRDVRCASSRCTTTSRACWPISPARSPRRASTSTSSTWRPTTASCSAHPICGLRAALGQG